MSQPASWSLAARLARREARGGIGALRLLFACLLLGVFAIAGVGSLSGSILSGIDSQSRDILGGDIEARFTQGQPTAGERAALQALGPTSDSIRMRAMVRTVTAPAQQVLGELKAVDSSWPLYGTAALEGGAGNAGVQQALRRGVVLDAALAAQLGLGVGDSVDLGEARLPVAGILASEPDRASEGFQLGPTILLGLDMLPQTALLQPGSLYRQHVRVRLRDGADPAAVVRVLDQQFPDSSWQLQDRSNAAPGIRRFVLRLGQFLTLVGLVSLAVAGVGVGNGVESYLAGRGSTIATLKALGAGTVLVRRTYLLLIGAVAVLAAVAGAALGALVPFLVAGILQPLLPVEIEAGVHPTSLILAAGLGLLVALLFALLPLARASSLPVRTLLRGVAEAWPPPSRRTLLLVAATAALLLAIVLVQARDRLFTLGFLAAVAATLALLFAFGLALMRGGRRLPPPSSLLLRLALRNLVQPGAMTRQLVVALGLGLTLFAALSFIESSFNGELRATIPDRAPAFFLLDLPKGEEAQFHALLPPGSSVRMVPSLRGPVVAVNGIPARSIRNVPAESYVLRGDRGLTFASEVPEGNRIVAGRWWPADYQGPPLVSMDAEQARLLGLGVGDKLTVAVLGVDITATIASLREVNWDSFGFNFVLVFDPATLAGAPYSWMATVTPPPAAIDGFEARMARSFPTISIIRVRDVLDQVGGVLRQTGLAVRAAALAAILAGIAVLIGALAAQARARTRDNVILKALGATRRQLLAAALLEQALLATVLALVALLLGAVAGWVVITRVMEFHWQPDWWAAVATVLAGGALVLALGLAGSWRTLGASVASALREP